MKAWHFIQADRRLRYDDGREVKVGETLYYEGAEPLELCKRGMHASVRLLDALGYAPGLMLCEVLIDGDVQHGDDKIVGRSRRVLRMIDATALIVEFANVCAGRAAKHAAYAARAVDYAAAAAADAARAAAHAAHAAAARAADYAAAAAADAADAAYAAYAAADAAAYQNERNEQEKILTALVESAFAAHENAGQ